MLPGQAKPRSGAVPNSFRLLCLVVALVSVAPAVYQIRQLLDDARAPPSAPAINYLQPERAAAVVEAVIRLAFDAYSRHAWGRDELLPLSGDGDDQ